MVTAVAHTYPAYRELVKEHLELTDQPLLLALYYAPERDEDDVFLLEVIENFASGRIDVDKELFEMAFSSRSGFRIEEGRWAHLVLTNPNELKAAVQEHWASADEIKAVQQGRAEVIYSSPDAGEKMLRILRG